MREFETMFILNPDRTDEEREGLLERIKGIIEKNGGEILAEDHPGNKKLAYEVQDYTSGFYGLFQFKGEPRVKDELERNFRLMDDVLRFLVIRMEKVKQD